MEGQSVKAGQILAEIQDNDPNLLENLRSKQIATKSRIDFAKNRVEALTYQIAQQELAKTQALDAARERVAAADIAAKTAELDHRRVSTLFGKGLASRRDHEQAILKRDASASDHRSAEAKLKQTDNDYASVIASIDASRNSAQSDIASAERELTTLDISLNQNKRQLVTAPRDGIVLNVPVTDGSYLNPGALICVIIPETESRFVEIWVDGNDVPLIKPRTEVDDVVIPGSTVRLAFEGWPAVQAVGWPQLAVGTFNGEVIFVDATDDGSGRFRVVVGPKDDVVDRGDGQGPVKVGWPSGERWLRQGVQAKAWVLLDEVPLWFELWRQINGFPAIGTGLKPEATN
jgi:biotin carboxyl carrier protein